MLDYHLYDVTSDHFCVYIYIYISRMHVLCILLPGIIINISITTNNGGCGKGEVHIDWATVTPEKERQDSLQKLPCWGLLALCRRTLGSFNAIGMQLRDPKNSGLAR